MDYHTPKEKKEPQESMTIRPLVRALVVGGHGPFVEDRLRENLKKHGITIVHHWDYALRRPPDLPADIDVMYICTDCVSHPLSAAAIAVAKKRGIRILNGGRKWASTAQYLRLAGFPDRQPSSVSLNAIPTNIPITLSANVEPRPQETMTTVSFPEPKASSDLIPYIRMLCKHPTIKNPDLFARLLQDTPGFRFNERCAQRARVHLRIRVGYSAKRGIFCETTDPEHLRVISDALGVTPEASPLQPAQPVLVIPPVSPVTAVPPVEGIEEVVAVKQPRVRPTIPKKVKVIMPAVPASKIPVASVKSFAPVVATAPVPAPVPEEIRPIVNVTPVKLTMKVLIDELRAKMLMFDIDEITITQTTAPAKLRATVDLG